MPLRVPSWTWKTGLSVTPEDCNRVFNTSRGQVTMAPTVPLHLQIEHKKIRMVGKQKRKCTTKYTHSLKYCCSFSCKVTHISFDCGEGFFHRNTAEDLLAGGYKQSWSKTAVLCCSQNTPALTQHICCTVLSQTL